MEEVKYDERLGHSSIHLAAPYGKYESSRHPRMLCFHRFPRDG